MAQLPGRPDLDQLRRIAKELHRAAAGEILAAFNGFVRCQSAQASQRLSWRWRGSTGLAVGRACGVPWWTDAAGRRQRGFRQVRQGGGLRRGRLCVLGAAKRLEGGGVACRRGVQRTIVITAHLQRHRRSYRLSDTLTPTNGRVFLTRTQRPVAVACLGVGALARAARHPRGALVHRDRSGSRRVVGCRLRRLRRHRLRRLETTGSLTTTLRPPPTRSRTAV